MTDMQRTSSDAMNLDRDGSAGVLAQLFRQTYGSRVDIVTRGGTVTVSRGRLAAQVQVLDDARFLVATRRNRTFHMHPDPVDRQVMARLVDEVVGQDAEFEIP